MPDPVLLAIAAAVAAKGAEAVVEGGRNAVTALTRLVRGRIGAGDADGDALRAALERPDDPERRERLAVVIGRLVDTDPAFADRLRTCWPPAAAELATTGPGGVVNHFTGTAAGPVIQARDIRGDVTF